MTRALIFGIGGQDGSYLADLLLARGYEVHGLYRHTSTNNLGRIAHLRDRVTLHQGDLCDPLSIESAIERSRPQEIYNEADQDNVSWSHALPCYSTDVTAGAVLRTLEIIRRFNPGIRFFQPCTATMYGMTPPPQDESTPFDPRSPYALGKTFAYYACRHYRRTYGMFVCTGILYNHDSPRRSENYLLHKICQGAARIAAGKQDTIAVGNLHLQVDIGYAREYMEAAVAMLSHADPDDYVICSGTAWSIRQMIQEALSVVGVITSRDEADQYITVDPSLMTPGVQPTLRGCYAKAEKVLGWKPTTKMPDLIRLLLQGQKEQ